MDRDNNSWTRLLQEAVTRPGMLLEAYGYFHNYSIGNQILALVQCQERQIQPGPIATYPAWKERGRQVRKGERALMLCMPITCKSKDEVNEHEGTFTRFIYKPRWFVLSQTDGEPVEPTLPPTWDKARALATLSISEIPFDELSGNIQGFARKRGIAISPIAVMPHKTLFHEVAHLCCLRGYVVLSR